MPPIIAQMLVAQCPNDLKCKKIIRCIISQSVTHQIFNELPVSIKDKNHTRMPIQFSSFSILIYLVIPFV
jgi:hypothetical protein